MIHRNIKSNIERVSPIAAMIPQEIIDRYFNDPSKRITLLSGDSFLGYNSLVIDFLNKSFGPNENLVALKGLGANPNDFNSVFMEFFFDGHPKAVKIDEQVLKAAGIILPDSGIIDTQNIPDAERAELKASILQLKSKVFEPGQLASVEELEAMKFRTLGDKKKQQITTDFSIYANAHVFDLKVKDKLGNVVIVPTFKNSPVISDKCEILGVGPETIKNWTKVLGESDLLIVLGSSKLYAEILRGYNGKVLNWDSLKRMTNPTVDKIKSSRILGGMHVEDNMGIAPILLKANIIPEFSDLVALTQFRQRDTVSVVCFDIGADDIEKAQQAAQAGANILISSQVVSEQLIATIKQQYPQMVVISGAKDLAQAQQAISNKTDGIKIKPWAKPAELLTENMVLAKTLKQRYPELIILGAGGIVEGNIQQSFSVLDAVGMGFDNESEVKEKLPWVSGGRQ